jgi:DNA-binding CsgD family transcriptional regulator/PAS domain-containing protein
VDNEELSNLIGSIYDCALEPERWPTTLAAVARASQSAMSFIVLHDLQNNLGGRFYDYGFDDHWLRLYFEKFAAVNPIPPAAVLRPVGDVYTTGALLDPRVWSQNEFYLGWMKPQGLRDMLGMLALYTGQRGAWLGVIRREEQSEFGEPEHGLFRLLSPHVCRTLKISDALDIRTITSNTLSETLDKLTSGVFLLDHQGRVVHMNRAAQRQIEASNALRIVDGRLAPSDRAAEAALGKALSDCRTKFPGSETTAHSIALPNADEQGLVATVLPVDQGNRRRIIAPYSAAVAVFVQDPRSARPLPGDAFAKLYGITNGELKFLMVLGSGLTIKQAADVLGVSEETGRTHLKRVFMKTGTSKQSELIRLVMGSSPPVSVRAH